MSLRFPHVNCQKLMESLRLYSMLGQLCDTFTEIYSLSRAGCQTLSTTSVLPFLSSCNVRLQKLKNKLQFLNHISNKGELLCQKDFCLAKLYFPIQNVGMFWFYFKAVQLFTISFSMWCLIDQQNCQFLMCGFVLYFFILTLLSHCKFHFCCWWSMIAFIGNE